MFRNYIVLILVPMVPYRFGIEKASQLTRP